MAQHIIDLVEDVTPDPTDLVVISAYDGSYDRKVQIQHLLAAAGGVPSDGSYAAAGTVALKTRVTGDPEPRWVLHAGGLQEWGDGTSAPDTTLSRGGLFQLDTNGYFTAGAEIVSRYGVAGETRIGGRGPAGEAGVSFGAGLGDAVIFRSAANTLSMNGGIFQAGYGRFGSDVSFVDYNALRATSIAASATASVIKGFAGQTANLTEWQSSLGATLSRVAADGAVYGPGFFTGPVAMTNAVYTPSVLSLSFTGPTLAFDGSTSLFTQSAGKAAFPVLIVEGATAQTQDLQRWVDSTTATLAKVDNLGQFWTSVVSAVDATGSYLTLHSHATYFQNRTAGDVAFAVQGAGSQTGDLQQWRDSGGAALAYIRSDGALYTNVVGGISASADLYVGDTADTGVVWFRRSILANASVITGTPLVSRGLAGQTGDLEQWQNSTGGVLAAVAASGAISGAGLNITAGGAVRADYLTDLSNAKAYLDTSLAGWSFRLVERATADVVLGVVAVSGQTGDLTRWLDGTGATVASISANGTGEFGGSGVLTKYVQGHAATGPYIDVDNGATIQIYNRTATTNIVHVVQGMAAQSGDLTRWQDSTSNTLAYLAYNGSMYATALMGLNDSGGVTRGFVRSDGAGNLVACPTGTGALYLNYDSGTGGVNFCDGANAITFLVHSSGLPRWFLAGNQQTTVGAAGGASALPATPTKYLKVLDSAGTVLVIPAYAA